MNDLIAIIQRYVSETLLGGVAIDVNDSLFRRGVLDSIEQMRLIVFLEKEFGTKISLADLTAENFDSIAKIAQMVKSKR